MPRLIHALPKYTLHKPSGQARVKYLGKTKYLGPYGSPESRAAYSHFVANLPGPNCEAVTAEPARAHAAHRDHLIGELVLRFYEHAKVYYRRNGEPTGEHFVIRSCLRPLTKRFGQLPANEFGPLKLETVREDMIGLGWTRGTINKAVSVVKRLFRWSAQKELVSGEVAGRIWAIKGLQKDRSPAREKATPGPVSDEDVDKTLAHVSEQVVSLIRTMRVTGMRPGEALAMTADQIDRSDPTLWVYRPRFHKTSHKGKARSIMLGPKAQRILLSWILKAGPNERVFPIRRDSLRQAIHRGCKRAGVDNWSPNQVRHSVATEVRARFGLEAAQVVLGHAKADVTQTYAERDMRQAAEIARKIG